MQLEIRPKSCKAKNMLKGKIDLYKDYAQPVSQDTVPQKKEPKRKVKTEELVASFGESEPIEHPAIPPESIPTTTEDGRQNEN